MPLDNIALENIRGSISMVSSKSSSNTFMGKTCRVGCSPGCGGSGVIGERGNGGYFYFGGSNNGVGSNYWGMN